VSTLLKRSARVLAAIAVTSVAACGGSAAVPPGPDTAGGGDAWGTIRLSGLDEVEGYTDVLAMRDAADLVVVGSFTGFARGREVTIPDGLGTGVDDVLIWVEGRLRIQEILHSAEYLQPLDEVLAEGVLTEGGTVLTVEFFAGGAEAQAQITEGIARMNADLVDRGTGEVDKRAVLFLRMNGGPGEPEPAGPEDPLSTAPRAATCEITVDRSVVAGLPEGEVFDPRRHYPGYDEERHGACLFRLPDEGTPRLSSAPAQGDVDDLGRLRLTWSYGLITGTEEHPVDAPLGEVPEEAPAVLRQAEDPRDVWSDLDTFIDYVRTG
jgi:hypothetical protein